MIALSAACASLRFHDFELLVECDDAAILEAVRRRFAADAASVAGPPVETLRLVVRTVPAAAVPRPAAGGRLVYESPRGRAYWYDDERLELATDAGHAVCRPAGDTAEITVAAGAGDRVWTASRPLLTLTLAELLKARGLFFLHAGAVQVTEGSLLLPGTSGAGKSTLTAALARDGLALLGDDSVFLERAAGTLRVRRFVDEVDLAERSLELLGLGCGDRRRLAGIEKAQLGAGELGVRVGDATTAPRFLVFPALSADGPKLRPVSVDEALLELMPNVLLTSAATTELHVSLLAELAGSARAFRLDVSPDLQAAVRLLRAELAS
jgi:hypothetical protein